MLVLERKPKQAIILTCKDGTEIRVVVNRVKGCRVSLGVEADRRVAIRREELPKREAA